MGLFFVLELFVGRRHGWPSAPAFVGGGELAVGGDDAGLLADLQALLWGQRKDGLTDGLGRARVRGCMGGADVGCGLFVVFAIAAILSNGPDGEDVLRLAHTCQINQIVLI